jgi:hypothetical protein
MTMQGQLKKQKTLDTRLNEGILTSSSVVMERLTNTMWSSGYGATHTFISHVFNRTNLGKKIMLVLAIAAVLEVLEELF